MRFVWESEVERRPQTALGRAGGIESRLGMGPWPFSALGATGKGSYEGNFNHGFAEGRAIHGFPAVFDGRVTKRPTD